MFSMIAGGGRRQFRYITSAIMTAGMPTTNNRQPSLVMQLMMVNGSRISVRAMLTGKVTNLNSLKTI